MPAEDESFLTAADDLVKDHEEKKERAEMSIIAPEDITSKKLHAVLKKHFGFSRFREGQKKAIKRILRNKSTLLIIPTGEGKSLCYQFVSYFRPNELVVVVSPLLALMKDQEKNLPPFLKDQGVCLNSSMSLSEQIEVIDRIKKNEVRILFVSPEKVRCSAAQHRLAFLPSHCCATTATHGGRGSSPARTLSSSARASLP